MGREQDLLDAARTGNVAVIEKLLTNRTRKSSGGGGLTSALASLWNLKSVNINCTDTSGETPLHLAALNGHREVVSILLQSEANPAAVDTRGCTPLHLAAWSGNSDICYMLLNPSAPATLSTVNLQNGDGDTPLHCAAQHGHATTVSILLQNKSDPAIRNLGDLTPLELAAQYGRLDVVIHLIKTHPGLVNHVVPTHTPLHLASRSGHLAVVEYLLNSGIQVNLKTDAGTALHEAATYCKVDVIQLLLERGIDVNIRDKSSLSAEDILKTLPSQKAYQAQQLIENYHSNHLSAFNTVHTPDSDTAFSGTETPESSPLKKPTPQPPKSIEELYSKPFKDKVNIQEVEFEDRSSGVESPPPPPLPPRMPSIKSSNKSNTQISVSSSNDSCFEANPPQDVPLPVPQVPKSGYIPMGAIFPDATPGVKLEHPKKPPRQRKQPSPNPDSISTKSHSSSVKSDELSVSTTDSLERSVDSDMKRHSSNYVFMEGISFEKTDSNAESDSVYVNSAEIKTAATKEQLTNDLSVEPTNETSVVENSRKHFPNYCNVLIGGPGKMEIEMAEDKTLDDESEVETNTSTDPQTNTSNDDSTVINGDSSQSNEGDRTSKPLTLDFCNKRTSSVGEDAPVSPTGYVQPPTPDQPPPSPSTALHGIHQKLNPQDKRKSKDMETLTDAILLNPGGLSDIPELFPGNNAKLQNIEKLDNEETLPSDNLQTVDKTTSDEKVVSDNMKSSISNEIAAGIRGDNSNQPKMRKTSSSSTSTGGSVSDSEVELNIFAGLLRGSAPGGSRNVVSQICENVVVKRIKSNRRSAPSSFFTFDPLMEKEEEKEIDTEEVIAAIDAITTEAKHPTHQKPSSKSDESVFDDAEEWNKIAATLATFGAGFARESVFVKEYEADFARLLAGSNSIHSVGEWLEIIGLEQYENTLIANGFDDTDFLGNSILEDSELESIGIKVVEHRKKILDSAKLLPSLQPIDQNNLSSSVEEWLKTIRLEDYWDTFKSHGYDSMERVVKLWELELSTVLDISSVGHRRRILASLGDRPLPDIKETNNQTPTLIIDPGEEVSSPFEHIDLYKDYTRVRSRLSDESDEPPQNPLLMMDGQESDDSGKQGQSIKDSTIHIRPPHLAHTTGSIRQWRHRPEVLIKGCCNYTSQYLGSTLVKELNGPESTQEGIAKLKKSTDVIAKIPTIMLSISYRGVKFIDAKSKKVICDHEIANIFCACQDSEHMNFFAYITKDRETAKHYCHVFSVRSRELAGEIILTLGEAFEIAYQMALKEKAEEDAFEFELKLSQSDLDDSTSISSKASISTV